MPIPLALLAAPAIIQGVTSASQLIKAKKMQKELGDRVDYEIPEEAKRAYSLAQRLAAPREMAGQASMQAMMDYQAQKALGTFSRGATSSTDMAALSADVAERQFESQLGLGVEAAKDYQQRQQALYGAMQNMAGYQEKVTADKQQDWYERAEAAAQMKEGGLQNLMGAAQGLGQMGMMKMMYGGGGAVDAVRPSLSEGVEKIGSIGASQLPIGGTPTGLKPVTGLNGNIYNFGPPAGIPTAASINQMLGFQQNTNYSPGMFNPTSGAIFPMQSMTSFTGAPRGLMPTTSFKDVMNLYNIFH